MMMPMLRRPPQDALLRRALRQHREHELTRPAGRVGTMRKVAMITGADRENSPPVEGDADRDGLPDDARSCRRDADQMHHHEGNGLRIDDVLTVGGFIVKNGVSMCHDANSAPRGCGCTKVRRASSLEGTAFASINNT